MDGPSVTDIKDHLQQMDPYGFEQVVAEVWSAYGYETEITRGSDDGGVDVEATKDNPVEQKHVIQAKRYNESNKVGVNEVKDYSLLYRQEEDADIVVVVTTSEFTSRAVEKAPDLGVRLFNGIKLAKQVQSHLDEIESLSVHDVVDTSEKEDTGSTSHTENEVASTASTLHVESKEDDAGSTSSTEESDREKKQCQYCGKSVYYLGVHERRCDERPNPEVNDSENNSEANWRGVSKAAAGQKTKDEDGGAHNDSATDEETPPDDSANSEEQSDWIRVKGEPTDTTQNTTDEEYSDKAKEYDKEFDKKR